MRPREARVEFRRDVVRRKAGRGNAATAVLVDEGRLLDHPWHVPTDAELEAAAGARFDRLFPDLRGGWAGLSDENRETQVKLAELYVVDVVGPTAVRVLEQAAARADAESCPKVAAWLRSLSREVEV